MSDTTDRTSEGFVTLEVDGEPRLAVKVSGHTRSMAGQLQSLRRGHGWIVKNDRIESWEITGLMEHEGAIYAYGPYRESRPLTALFAMEPQQAVDGVYELARALETLRDRSIDPGKYEPQFILRLEGGGLLFLPENVIDGALSSQTERERVSLFDPFNHPDLRGERNACFLVGVLTYRALTGRLPYTGENSEELHERIRQQKILPPHLSVPGVREDLSQMVVRSFDPERTVTLDQCAEQLGTAKREGVMRELSSQEQERIRDSAEKLSKSSEAGYRRKVFFRKNWRTIVIVAGIVVVVGAVGGSILKNVLKPRITVGMTPRQVVHLYYTSMSTFDSQAMQDAVIDGAGKKAISEATNLYVITRVREGYQHSTGYVSAQRWLNAGKPKLKPGTSVYGVANLKITEDSKRVFTVRYEKWQPYVPQQQSQQPPNPNAPIIMKVQGRQHLDKVYLKNEGNFWAIYRIDHVVDKKLGPPITVTNPKAKTNPPILQPRRLPVGSSKGKAPAPAGSTG